MCLLAIRHQGKITLISIYNNLCAVPVKGGNSDDTEMNMYVYVLKGFYDKCIDFTSDSGEAVFHKPLLTTDLGFGQKQLNV